MSATLAQTVSAKLSSAAAATATATGYRAVPQGGVLEGANPSVYDPKNPIILFIIQVCAFFFLRAVSADMEYRNELYEAVVGVVWILDKA